MIRTKSILFICGAQSSEGRDFLKKFIEKERHDSMAVFYAEEVWEEQEPEETNALEMESILADISDCLVLIVESPGTFAELGAFTMSEQIRRKLLVLMDKRYKEQKSFINLGPVYAFGSDKKSKYRPVIYTDLSVISDCVEEFNDRLSKVRMPHADNVSVLSRNRKKMLYILCELIALTGPATAREVFPIAQELDKEITKKKVLLFIGLAKSLGLVKAMKYNNETYYYRSLQRLDSTAHDMKVNLRLSRIRLKALAVIQTFPEGRELIRRVASGATD